MTKRMDPHHNWGGRARDPRGGPRDPGSRDSNGDVGCDGVEGRRYPVRHPRAAARYPAPPLRGEARLRQTLRGSSTVGHRPPTFLW